jgi:hypothetical protein
MIMEYLTVTNEKLKKDGEEAVLLVIMRSKKWRNNEKDFRYHLR